MRLEGKNIGFAITASFCTLAKVEKQVENLVAQKANVFPIFSYHVQTIPSRFGDVQTYIKRIADLTGNPAILTIDQAEPIGPQNDLDALVIAPCTGNTLAKLVNAITDTPVLMAAKAHLRNAKPIVIALATNDALGMNFKNVGALLNVKHVYFVPFGQDDPMKKPCSLIADADLILPALEHALDGKQMQPILRA